MKTLVCGAGGFIGGHLVARLKDDGHWVRGVDIQEPEFRPTVADEFQVRDLLVRAECTEALAIGGGFDEVFQVAADMGGMGFIHSSECEIMRNNALMNLNLIDAAAEAGVGRYFFSSSVCVYRDMLPGEAEINEDDAYPALPDNEYGWEKLYAERVVAAYGRKHGFETRIARFQNCYGPFGTWRGGREKAPAATCRKVAEASHGDEIEVWGDGSAVRCYIYVDDLVEGVLTLMRSEEDRSTNIGTREYVTVAELVDTVIEASGKDLKIRYVDGPVGVQSRNFSNDRIEALGWKAEHAVRDGIAATYPWVAAQVEAGR
jgi:nucleoside-diphosphate-sugar epimerase